MPKPAWLILDTKDDRKEIHHLLAALPPAARMEFLAWCCRQVVLPQTRTHPVPSARMAPRFAEARHSDSADERLTMEIYFDFWRLCNTYGLDPTAAAAELERRAKAIR